MAAAAATAVVRWPLAREQAAAETDGLGGQRAQIILMNGSGGSLGLAAGGAVEKARALANKLVALVDLVVSAALLFPLALFSPPTERALLQRGASLATRPPSPLSCSSFQLDHIDSNANHRPTNEGYKFRSIATRLACLMTSR